MRTLHILNYTAVADSLSHFTKYVSRHIVPMYLRICLLYDVSEGRDVSYFDDNIAIVEVSTSWHSSLNATRC